MVARMFSTMNGIETNFRCIIHKKMHLTPLPNQFNGSDEAIPNLHKIFKSKKLFLKVTILHKTSSSPWALIILFIIRISLFIVCSNDRLLRWWLSCLQWNNPEYSLIWLCWSCMKTSNLDILKKKKNAQVCQCVRADSQQAFADGRWRDLRPICPETPCWERFQGDS